MFFHIASSVADHTIYETTKPAAAVRRGGFSYSVDGLGVLGHRAGPAALTVATVATSATVAAVATEACALVRAGHELSL